MLKRSFNCVSGFRCVIALLTLALVAAVAAPASYGGFSATLSAEQKTLIGLTDLSLDERNALDRLVAVDVTEARKEDAREFASRFVARQSDEEKKQAGLDRLTADQVAKLDSLVAAAIAASPKPKERPRIKESDIFSPKKPEVHGGVSLTYGRASGGGDFRAASMWVDYFDPNTGLGFGVGVSRFKGNGFIGYYPDQCGLSSDYDLGLGYYGYPYRGLGGVNLYGADRRSVRLSASWKNLSFDTIQQRRTRFAP